MSRIDGRKNDELRPVEIIPNINKFAEGSCLIRCGNTHVLCTASVEDKPPRHVPEGEGWVTAEYSMLPRANRERSRRDISKLKLNGRSAEIQRLIDACGDFAHDPSVDAVIATGFATPTNNTSNAKPLPNGLPYPEEWTPPMVSPALARFKISWENFVDTLMREWKTFNLVSALLLA